MIPSCSRRPPHSRVAFLPQQKLTPSICIATGRQQRLVLARISLYELLGIGSTASNAEIRAAYRRLATLYHPDVNTSLQAHEKFQALKLASHVLTSELRQLYDKEGLGALTGGEFKLLHDFITKVRAQGSAAVLGECGSDISTVLGLEFQEAVTGSACTVTTGALGMCPDCQGSGFDASQQADTCPMCHGKGELTFKKWVGSGQPRVEVLELCPACRGNGKSDLRHCSRCAGEGRVHVRRHVRIRVPAGCVDGQVLRVKGQGHSGKYGGAPGDLLVKLQVYDLADVRREGDDLYSQLSLGLYEVMLGCSVSVKTVRGERDLHIPAGTQHGELLCARGAGVARPSVNGVVYGHHYFEVAVEIPTTQAACDTELQLLGQLAQLVRAQQEWGHHQQQQQQQQWPQDQEQLGQQAATRQQQMQQEQQQGQCPPPSEGEEMQTRQQQQQQQGRNEMQTENNLTLDQSIIGSQQEQEQAQLCNNASPAAQPPSAAQQQQEHLGHQDLPDLGDLSWGNI